MHYKQIKKVKAIRHFNKASSVFSPFLADNKSRLDAAFDEDKQYLKVAKFMKDEE